LEPRSARPSVHYAGTDQELDRRAERARIAKRSRKLLHEETRLFPDLTNESLERMAKIAVGLNPDDKPKEREFQFPDDPASIAKARRQAQAPMDRLRSTPEADNEDYDE
jgi:hypothetical protein